MKLSYNRFFFYIFIIISIFFLDRLSKLYVLNYASANEQVNIVVNDFLNIIMTKSFQFGLDKIADAFQKRAEELFNKA